MSEEEREESKPREAVDEAVLIFPKASIKRIMKIDPETRQISSVSKPGKRDCCCDHC